MTLRSIVALAAAVALLVLLTTGNVVPAAFLFIGYVVWLPFRDARERRGGHRAWSREERP